MATLGDSRGMLAATADDAELPGTFK